MELTGYFKEVDLVFEKADGIDNKLSTAKTLFAFFEDKFARELKLTGSVQIVGWVVGHTRPDFSSHSAAAVHTNDIVSISRGYGECPWGKYNYVATTKSGSHYAFESLAFNTFCMFSDAKKYGETQFSYRYFPKSFEGRIFDKNGKTIEFI